jgi:peroxiredoxin
MMKKVSKVIILLAVVTAFSFAGNKAVFAGKLGTKKPFKYKKGDMVKEFKLVDGISKAMVSFEKDIKGSAKVIALTFMTTSCSACKAEMTLVSDLTNRYGEEDFKAYAIAVDLNGDKTVPGYDENFGFNVTYLLDPDFTIPHQFGFTYTPSMVIIDGTGKVIFLKGGYSPSSDPDKIIKVVKGAL